MAAPRYVQGPEIEGAVAMLMRPLVVKRKYVPSSRADDVGVVDGAGAVTCAFADGRVSCCGGEGGGEEEEGAEEGQGEERHAGRFVWLFVCLVGVCLGQAESK